MIELSDNIIELNRDMESFVIQGSATRPVPFKQKFGDCFKPLQFVHFSDIHAVLNLWNRIMEYVNYYSDYISFGLHTGDYCGNNQNLYVDFYNYGMECERPIYNCVGNHDTYGDRKYKLATKESVHKLLFAPQPDITQDVNFMECEYSMTYYKDFKDSNVRLIVLDLYYDIPAQQQWLEGVLADAKEKGFNVITAMHEPTGHICDSFGVTFHSINDYESLEGKGQTKSFETQIVEFIESGGEYICNLAGHHHHDLFGLTEAGVLNVCVPSATNWDGWCDGKRIRGTRTYDCFNVVSVDTNLGLLKIARVGCNVDHYFRSQRALCFDYINKKVIHCE